MITLHLISCLDKGELDANYFQHVPYLKTESKEKGYKIEDAGKSSFRTNGCLF